MSVRTPPGRTLLLLAGVAFVLRLAYALFFVDLQQDYYWEYGEIAKNIRAGNGYALFYPHDGAIAFRFNPEAKPFPSAFMPPGYVAFLYPFLSIADIPVRNTLLIGVQSLAAVLLVLALYRLTREFFDEGAALTAAGIAALLPEFVYAAGSYTPTVMYHLLVVLLLWHLYLLHARRALKGREMGALAAVCVALMYLRSESVILVLLTAVVLSRRQGWVKGVMLLLVVGAAYAPWTIRNSRTFGECIPMTTSSGLNLFRGHNLDEHGAWSDSVIDAQRDGLPMNASYEPALDRVFRARVGAIIREAPVREPVRAAQKLWYLWVLNPLEGRARHPLYIGPWIILLGLAAHGASRSKPLARHIPLFIFLGYSTFVALLFFVLPRYQTMMKVALIPLAAVGLQELWRQYIRPFSDGSGLKSLH